ncbi:PEBP-like protein [Xylona heveae TC161]|uniref:PEBP-like protein n=1 Tax=Xylona heveae (strain CBS 132557 / TC161) TaxID=1328760 RepID=A0A165HQD4_XYLHT|nr:PEBP-like protein [Xylona heveae TC161]KZF23831.1 PEBP-like protein [Xylona heveae TC161]
MSLGTIGQSVRDELKKSSIIDDVIDDFHPSLLLTITYPKSNVSANLGNTIKPSDAQQPPVVELHSSDGSASSHESTYTLVMTDPDAPSREDPKWSEFCHWIITNVPLSNTNGGAGAGAAKSAEAQESAHGLKEIIEYKGPAPPPKTGKHRYVLLAFEHKHHHHNKGNTGGGPSSSSHLSAPSERKQWGTGKVRHGARQWAEKNGLVPVGANFFYAQNNEQ